MSNSKSSIQYPVIKLNVPDDNYKFQPLPAPTGKWPYHLELSQVVENSYPSKLVFHMAGDTGSAKQPRFQKLVAQHMIKQMDLAENPEDKPLFLFHLGDVVYHFGEAEEYYRQFFEPYSRYPAPIFAIAGNHDSDVNPAARKPYKSLDAFTSVFCDTRQQPIDLARDSNRKTNVQPNVYYTLKAPLANFICLYSNVPKFGVVKQEQKDWFVQELKAAAQDRSKMMIVCIHHAPYSADGNHGSSEPMINFLEDAYRQAGVRPHIVFSGHVHNYQRFSRLNDDGSSTPYIVSGAGGYVTLFPLVQANGTEYIDQHTLLQNVTLKNYCDWEHGFLKISIEKQPGRLRLTGEYYIIPHDLDKADDIELNLFDTFEVAVDTSALLNPAS